MATCDLAKVHRLFYMITGKFHPSPMKLCLNIWPQSSFCSTIERWNLWNSTNTVMFLLYTSSTNLTSLLGIVALNLKGMSHDSIVFNINMETRLVNGIQSTCHWQNTVDFLTELGGNSSDIFHPKNAHTPLLHQSFKCRTPLWLAHAIANKALCNNYMDGGGGLGNG